MIQLSKEGVQFLLGNDILAAESSQVVQYVGDDGLFDQCAHAVCFRGSGATDPSNNFVQLAFGKRQLEAKGGPYQHHHRRIEPPIFLGNPQGRQRVVDVGH